MIASCPAIDCSKTEHYSCISSMEIIRYDIRKLPCLTQEQQSGYCGLFKISCGDFHGTAEFMLPEDSRPTDFIKWAFVFKSLRGLTPQVASQFVAQHEHDWGIVRVSIAKRALDDLEKQLERTPHSPNLVSREDMRAFLMQYALTYFSF